MSQRPDLMGEMRLRVPLPLVIPLVSLAVIAAVAIGMSRVLLALPKEGATVVALAVAANILAGCAYYAVRPRLGRASMAELLIVAAYPLVIGIAITQVNFGSEAAETHGGAGDAPAGGATTAIVASGVQFDIDTINLAANEDVQLEFQNNDAGTVHNVAIYENEKDAQAQENAIFDGAEITGPTSTIYEFTAPAAGEYYFHCDVHPGMNGTVVVE